MSTRPMLTYQPTLCSGRGVRAAWLELLSPQLAGFVDSCRCYPSHRRQVQQRNSSSDNNPLWWWMVLVGVLSSPRGVPAVHDGGFHNLCQLPAGQTPNRSSMGGGTHRLGQRMHAAGCNLHLLTRQAGTIPGRVSGDAVSSSAQQHQGDQHAGRSHSAQPGRMRRRR